MSVLLDEVLKMPAMKGRPGDTITVTYGKELFAPIQYHSFEIGPFTYTTQIQENEDAEIAATRAYAFLMKVARATFVTKMTEFKQRAQGQVTK